ncbi:MAG: universal stress protein [Pseudomonadota bacterium]
MKRILMATDLSERSDRALRRAVALASAFRTELEVVHVVEEAWLEAITSQIEKTAHDAIAQQLQSIDAAKSVQPNIKVLRGWDHQDIIERSRELDVDLIVLGVHRHKAPELFQGTTAERVIRHGDRPVLVVKDAVSGPYRKAIVAVDLSAHSVAAASCAARLVHDGHVCFVHAMHRPFVGFLGRDSQEPHLRDERTRIATAMDKMIGDVSAVCESDVPEFSKAVDAGDVRGILRANAERLKPDLLAVGTHGRGGVAHAVLGSVAADILADAPCDVLVAKAA